MVDNIECNRQVQKEHPMQGKISYCIHSISVRYRGIIYMAWVFRVHQMGQTTMTLR